MEPADRKSSKSTVSTECSEAELPAHTAPPEATLRGPAGRNVVLQRVPAKASEKRVLAHLVQLGVGACFEELWIPRDRGSGLNKGYFFVRFRDAATAAEFVAKAHGTCFDGSAQELVAAYAPFGGAFPRVVPKGVGFGPVMVRPERD